jgi:hypothetical protein
MLLLDKQPLALPERDLIRYVRENIDPREVEQFSLQRSWTGPNAAPLGNFIHHRRDRPIELNRLYWPSGAVNWGYGYFHATQDDIDAIGADTWGSNGDTTSPITLYMDSPGQRSQGSSTSGQGSPGGETLTLSLYALPPVPLAQIADASGQPLVNNVFIIPLVSKRYFWQYKPLPVLGILNGGTSWTALFGQVSNALNEPLTIDMIEPEYLMADALLNVMAGDSAALLLDTCAFNVSMRVVEWYDGTIQVMGTDTARKVRQQDDSLFRDRTLRAGGSVFDMGAPYYSGLNAGIPIYSAVIPKAVQIRFPTKVCTGVRTGQENPYWIETVNLTDSDVPTNNLFITTQQKGFNGTKAFRDTAIAQIAAGGGTITPINETALRGLALEIAEEYWRWISDIAYDRVYNGIVGFKPEGYLDQIEFTYRFAEFPEGSETVSSVADQSYVSFGTTAFHTKAGGTLEQTTRVISLPWNAEPEELHHFAGDCPAAAGTGLCGPPAISVPTNPGRHQICQTLYQLQLRNSQVIQINTGKAACCVTVCCTSSTRTLTMTTPGPAKALMAHDSGPDSCVHCTPGAAAFVAVTVQGLAGDCEALNGVYRLKHIPDSCTWASFEGSATATLFWGGFGWELNLVGPAALAVFEQSRPYDCQPVAFPFNFVPSLSTCKCASEICQAVITSAPDES